MREPRVGDRVMVTAGRDELREICAEYALGLTGYVQEVDPEAHTRGIRHPFRVHFGPVEGSWWLRRSDFTLLDEEPDEHAHKPNTVWFDDLEAGRRYLDNEGDEFVVVRVDNITGKKLARYAHEEPNSVYLTRVGGLGPFTSVDEPEPTEPAQPPEPATPVRTKAETLAYMAAIEDDIRKIMTSPSPSASFEVSDGEREILASGFRALFDKLKESL